MRAFGPAPGRRLACFVRPRMPAAGPLFMVSLVIGFLLLWPLGWLFGQMGWPTFHTWGLFHGAFIIAWPLLTFATLAILLLILRLRSARK
jgi:hypothetical protein